MQPVLQQIRLFTGLNVGSKFATLVAAMLQNKLHFLVTQFTKEPVNIFFVSDLLFSQVLL